MFKYVYSLSEGSAQMRRLLGSKGANVAELMRMGLPVPDGFTVTTEACTEIMRRGSVWPEGLWEEIRSQLAALEERTGRRLGCQEKPLLVSVRSGAARSMPGMMDTILNLGIGQGTVAALAAETGDERFAWDSYRRFVQMYGEVVAGVPAEAYEAALSRLKRELGLETDADLSADDLSVVVRRFLDVSRSYSGAFPEDPHEQLRLAIDAVFRSWQNPRAAAYRRAHHIPDDLGTAVNVMRMVFGNLGAGSATGVCFTRNPSTGEKEPYGEFLLNAQGEDVVAGTRTPLPLAELVHALPEAHEELRRVMDRLEAHYRDVQDIEFTIERGRVYLLQTREAKRTAGAALKIARDLAEEGLISREEAVARIEPAQLEQLLHPRIDPEAEFEVACKGLGASPGAATGQIVLSADEAERRGRSGEAVILVRRETDPDDFHGMMAARGVLTAAGGMTSHAAVVARGAGKPAVTGCEALKLDGEGDGFRVGKRLLRSGDVITIDGTTGAVVLGEVPLVEPEPDENLRELLSWADGLRALAVRANVDTPEDAKKARELGAEGIGLCRTEHMFMEGGRLELMRGMLLAEGEGAVSAALARLEPLQRGDFEGIFRAMDGLPVTVRLLDPPLHEFLPSPEVLRAELSDLERVDGTSEEAEGLRRQLQVAEGHAESNPMLGLRGVRLGLLRPEVYRMQVRAIAEAARNVRAEGLKPVVEVMIPLVGFPEELERARREVEATLGELLGEEAAASIGTMVELPRACLVADEMARQADFFSFGTNDLTQTTLGFSRDDAEGKFLSHYLESGVLPDNPFETIDGGVGQLVQMACELGRRADPALKLGVCGEHGGDPRSIAFLHGLGIDYVSCSPYRVPVARLAAAQAALQNPTPGRRGAARATEVGVHAAR
jgi:pyruvate,orthophosphate dikinase